MFDSSSATEASRAFSILRAHAQANDGGQIGGTPLGGSADCQPDDFVRAEPEKAPVNRLPPLPEPSELTQRQLTQFLAGLPSAIIEVFRGRHANRSSWGYKEPPLYQRVPKYTQPGGKLNDNFNILLNEIRRQKPAMLSPNHAEIHCEGVWHKLLQHVQTDSPTPSILTVALARQAPDEPRLFASWAPHKSSRWVAVWWLGEHHLTEQGCATPMFQFKSSHAEEVALRYVESREGTDDRSHYELLVHCKYPFYLSPASSSIIKIFKINFD